jgi:rod shape-determining protein MreC
MKKFTSTKLFKIIFIAALFGLLIFINPQIIFSSMRSGLTLVLAPFQKVFYSISLGFENTKEFLGSISQLKRENGKLIKDNQELLAENSLLRDLKNENILLREQLGVLPRDRYDLIASFVVSQDPNGTGNWLEIDKGSRDGVKEGMSVIVSKGILIGRVQEVGAKSSRIILLTNPKSTINVMTLENGTKGVVRGEFGLGIIFDMILQADAIKAGDNVITSGVGGDIPRGLYVGIVQEIRPSDDHLFQQAAVITPLQVSKLQMVFVIKGNK